MKILVRTKLVHGLNNLIIILAIASCATAPKPQPTPTPEPTAEPTPSPTPEPTVQPTPTPVPTPNVVPICFGTDRTIQSSAVSSPGEYFGNDRGEKVTYGTVEVTIPIDHRPGKIEKPAWWKLEFSPDKNKHFTLQHLGTMDKTDFFNTIDRMAETGDSSALVFIHGFNVTFQEAAFTTGQFAYDLGYKGVPIFFSWPSQGKVEKYLVDQEDLNWAFQDIRNFLLDIIKRNSLDRIYLVAHSMGNRALTDAIIKIVTSDKSIKNKIKGIILAAPDIDAEIFNEQIGPQLVSLGLRTTMYVSSRDKALAASRAIFSARRAGEIPPVVPIQGIDIVDASLIDDDFIGHGYVANERDVLDDIAYVIKGLPPEQRFGLKKITVAAGHYFQIQ